MILDWKCSQLGQLSPEEVYDLLWLRVNTFIIEQDCPYPEIDGKDLIKDVYQVLGYDPDGVLAAYCRLLAPGVTFQNPGIGRVIVAQSHRDKKLGHVLMEKALGEAETLWPRMPLDISAQAHLEKYYARHGFKTISEPYIEDGIPHLHMRRGANGSS